MTINDALQHSTPLIGQRDTTLLLCHLTGSNTAHILLHGDKPLQNYEQFLAYVNRRIQGEPLQYIIGQWDFMGRTFKTDSRALIPRPETELLVEEALKFLAQIPNSDSINVLDLCTGSGCIAASIAAAGNYRVTAADISSDALSLARENSAGFDINFVQSDLFSNIHGLFDIIISNPPYISTCEMDTLSQTVLNYEPHLALHGGHGGMDIYRQLVPQSLNFLKPGGALLLEIGPEQVQDIMINCGFTNVKLKKDYAGLPRIAYGVK